MIATYNVKSMFGIERLYPTNHVAENLCALTGMKTLERRYIPFANALGLDILLHHEGEPYEAHAATHNNQG